MKKTIGKSVEKKIAPICLKVISYFPLFTKLQSNPTPNPPTPKGGEIQVVIVSDQLSLEMVFLIQNQSELHEKKTKQPNVKISES